MATEPSATGRTAERDAPRDGSPPEPPAERALTEIATALFHLRRVWAKPDLVKRVRAQTATATDGRPLQLSNLMVVNAVAALTAREHPAEPSCEVTVGAVAERLEVDPSTASRLVGHAIDAGLVSRRPSPVDARRANLGLTESGRRVKQVADRFRRAYLDDLMTDWSERERTEFARLLSRFADAAVRVPMYPDGIDRIFEEAAAD
jgi:DNA-binding MarR family transcriptional regulator